MNVYLVLQWDYFSNLFPKYLCTWEEKGRRQWENKKGTKPFQWALLYPKILMPIWHKAALVLTAVPAPALFQSKIITKIQRIKEKRLYTRNWCSTIPHIHDTGSGSQQVLNPGHLYLKGPGWWELLSMALGKPDTNLTQLYRLLLQIPNQTVLAPLSLTLQTDGT